MLRYGDVLGRARVVGVVGGGRDGWHAQRAGGVPSQIMGLSACNTLPTKDTQIKLDVLNF